MGDKKINVDFSFVKQREGGNKSIPYVPICNAKSVENISNKVCYGKPEGSVIGKSGVTFAAGFDAGQQNEYDLRRIGLSEVLIKKIAPFLGKKGQKALDVLEGLKNEKKTVVFTEFEMKEINDAVKRDNVKRLAAKYNKETGEDFANLPAGVQTALFSVGFQYGHGVFNEKGHFTTFWQACKEKNWAKAAKILEEQKHYSTRRKLEANLIKKDEEVKNPPRDYNMNILP